MYVLYLLLYNAYLPALETKPEHWEAEKVMGKTRKDHPYFRPGGHGYNNRGRDRSGSGRNDTSYDNADRFSGQARRQVIRSVEISQGLDMG